MAKIFRTEELSVNGDNIRLTSSSSLTFEFTDPSGNVIMSKETILSDVSSLNAQDVSYKQDRESDISSLNAYNLADTEDRESDVSSLQAVINVGIGADISSLQAVDVADKIDRESDVSSLQAALTVEDTERTNDVSSLNAKIELEDVKVMSEALTSGISSISVTFPDGGFASAPSVVGIIKGADANSPIIACQLSSKSATGATFQFSDDIPGTGFTLEILASV